MVNVSSEDEGLVDVDRLNSFMASTRLTPSVLTSGSFRAHDAQCLRHVLAPGALQYLHLKLSTSSVSYKISLLSSWITMMSVKDDPVPCIRLGKSVDDIMV